MGARTNTPLPLPPPAVWAGRLGGARPHTPLPLLASVSQPHGAAARGQLCWCGPARHHGRAGHAEPYDLAPALGHVALQVWMGVPCVAQGVVNGVPYECVAQDVVNGVPYAALEVAKAVPPAAARSRRQVWATGHAPRHAFWLEHYCCHACAHPACWEEEEEDTA